MELKFHHLAANSVTKPTGNEQGLSSTTSSSERWISSIGLDSTGVSCLESNKKAITKSFYNFTDILKTGFLHGIKETVPGMENKKIQKVFHKKMLV